MVFAAGLNYRYLLGVGIGLLPLLYMVMAIEEYRRDRLLSFLNPWADPLVAVSRLFSRRSRSGTGGVFGRGLMAGVQKLFYLPEPHTDFIYAVIAEETGLMGATAVVLCFCVITWRGLRIAVHAPDRSGLSSR